jgi:hypothetical protein
LKREYSIFIKQNKKADNYKIIKDKDDKDDKDKEDKKIKIRKIRR